MCWTRIRGSPRAINHLSFIKDIPPERRIQVVRRIQVYLPADDLAQIALHCKESQARSMSRLELHEHIDIAFS